MEILRVENLCKTYDKGEAKVNALRNVSISLEKGEFAAVVDESGSIFIDGQNLFSMKDEPTGNLDSKPSCPRCLAPP